MCIRDSPISAGVAYAIGDILGMMIFPSGSYFPGFTLTAFLTGVIYGVVLYLSLIHIYGDKKG